MSSASGFEIVRTAQPRPLLDPVGSTGSPVPGWFAVAAAVQPGPVLLMVDLVVELPLVSGGRPWRAFSFAQHIARPSRLASLPLRSTAHVVAGQTVRGSFLV